MSSQSNLSPELKRAGTEATADAAPLLTVDSGGHTHDTVPTRFAELAEMRFPYRRFGNPVGTPIVLLQHFMGNLDNYDPAITAELILFPDSNHGSLFQFTEPFNRYVTDFIER
jgi:hypothetical protein